MASPDAHAIMPTPTPLVDVSLALRGRARGPRKIKSKATGARAPMAPQDEGGVMRGRVLWVVETTLDGPTVDRWGRWGWHAGSSAGERGDGEE